MYRLFFFKKLLNILASLQACLVVSRSTAFDGPAPSILSAASEYLTKRRKRNGLAGRGRPSLPQSTFVHRVSRTKLIYRCYYLLYRRTIYLKANVSRASNLLKSDELD